MTKKLGVGGGKAAGYTWVTSGSGSGAGSWGPAGKLCAEPGGSAVKQVPGRQSYGLVTMLWN